MTSSATPSNAVSDCIADVAEVAQYFQILVPKSKSLKHLCELASFRAIDETAVLYTFYDSEVDGKFVVFKLDSQLSWPFMILQRFTLLIFPDWL